MPKRIDLQFISTLPDQAVLSDRHVAAIMGCALNTLRRLREKGDAPPLVRLSKGRHGSTWGAVKAWLKSREVRDAA